jgi:hypothetical protein
MKLRKYSIQFKYNCIKFIEIMGINKTANLFGVHRKCIRRWYLNKDNIKYFKDNNSIYRLPGGGAKLKYPKVEKQLITFIYKCLEIGIILNIDLIIKELCRIQPDFKNKKRNTLRKFCYNILKRHNLCVVDDSKYFLSERYFITPAYLKEGNWSNKDRTSMFIRKILKI